VALGGGGGEAAQHGRPGLGAQSGFARFGLADFVLPDGRRLSDFGRCGDGGAPLLSMKTDFVTSLR
jgi:hypothetical protein